MAKKEAVFGLICAKEEVEFWKRLGATTERLRAVNRVAIDRRRTAARISDPRIRHQAMFINMATDILALRTLRKEITRD